MWKINDITSLVNTPSWLYSCEIHARAWAAARVTSFMSTPQNGRKRTRKSDRAQECAYVFMYACAFLHVHISGREEWKEFPACFCMGGRIFEGGEPVTGCLGLTVKAQRKRSDKLYTTSTFHTRNVGVWGFVSFFIKNLFSLWQVTDTVFVCVCQWWWRGEDAWVHVSKVNEVEKPKHRQLHW